MDKETLMNAMSDLEEDSVYEIINEIQKKGEGAGEAIDAMQEGMDVIGERFETGEYFVGDLILAGEIMTNAMNTLKPLLRGDESGTGEKVLLCTVKNDLHDIGKNIVKTILEAGGFDVVDLGIDTAPEKIVEIAKEQDIHIIALSGVLTLAIDSMKATVDAFSTAGLRDQIKIIIGGAPITEKVCEVVGADAWADSPQKTLETCKAWAAE